MKQTEPSINTDVLDSDRVNIASSYALEAAILSYTTRRRFIMKTSKTTLQMG